MIEVFDKLNERFPEVIKFGDKVVGYFSYTPSGIVFCDGDACIIAGSESKLRAYLNQLPPTNEEDLIKKTRFVEIISGLKRGGDYVFDSEAYARFFKLCKQNGIDWLPIEPESETEGDMNFVMIQSPIPKSPTQSA